MQDDKYQVKVLFCDHENNFKQTSRTFSKQLNILQTCSNVRCAMNFQPEMNGS